MNIFGQDAATTQQMAEAVELSWKQRAEKAEAAQFKAEVCCALWSARFSRYESIAANGVNTIKTKILVQDYRDTVRDTQDCGKGWVSPEKHQELVERWQKCQRDYAEMGDRLIAKLDLMKDEFHRIRACSDCPAEIRQIAHRAVMDIRQHIPVIDQRDQALDKLNDAQIKLTLAVEALKRISSMSPFNIGIAQAWATEALAAIEKGESK